MPRHEDLTGRRFGLLTCLSFAGADENGMARWHVRCDCGTKFVTWRVNLLSGATRSCGCLRSALTAQRNSSRKRVSI